MELKSSLSMSGAKDYKERALRRRRVRYRTYPSPSFDLEEDDEPLLVACRHITFSLDVRFQSAVQQQDNFELDKILSTHGAQIDMNARNHIGLTALHQAVLNRNLDTVKLLLTRGSDANVQDSNGYAPLHTAAAYGLRNIVSLLIIFGADLFVRTLAGESPADLSKDVVTADLLMVEMCKQIQQHELMEKYGFLFRFIDLWETLWTNCCTLFEKVVEWAQSAVKNYYEVPQHHAQNGTINRGRKLP
ncbi:uncharacterized protein [Asterias amurensis]|uniref:uncharacterized protein n=1 Tax=Asterias amurensis TaxID=7602 RepID=UPI003AB3BE10